MKFRLCVKYVMGQRNGGIRPSILLPSLIVSFLIVSFVGTFAQAAHTNQALFPTVEMDTYMLIAENKILLSSFQLGSDTASEANMAVTKQNVDDTSIDNMVIWASAGIGLRVNGGNDVTMSNSVIQDSGQTAIPVTYNYNHGNNPRFLAK